MEKPIKSKYKLHDILNNRYSPRAFENKAVEAGKIEHILEAARWSPSASNDQPWRFVTGIKNQNDYYNIIFDSLVEFNQLWCKNVHVLILLLGEKKLPKTQKENVYYAYDTGQAAAHMTFQASAEGLYVHQIGGFDKNKLIKDLNIPGNYDPIAIMAVGYIGNPDELHENLKRIEYSPRERKNLDQIIFRGKW